MDTSSQDISPLHRTTRIVVIGLKYFIFHKINYQKRFSLGERLRFACEELGPVFIKLGQVLSTRYDLLEKSDCEALQKLLDDVAPVPYEAVRGLFISDFGKSPEDIYKEFTPTPIASASMAQVYIAIHNNGEKVAVKVRRPGITKTIKSDVSILKKIIKLAEFFSKDLQHIKATEVLSQLESWLFSEADFRQELKNINIATKFYTDRAKKENNFLVFPKPYPDQCSENIITMEFLDGIPVTKFDQTTAGPEYNGIASISAILKTYVRSWVEREPTFFHADPHAANVLILKNGRAGLLDFGLIGSFNKQDAEETCNMLIAVYSKNLDMSIKHALRLCRASREFDTPELRKDMLDYIEGTNSAGLGFWFMGCIKIFIKHRIPLPYQLILFGRANTLMDSLFERLAPGKSTLDIVGQELQTGLYKQIARNITTTNIAPVIYSLSEKLKESPEHVAKMIDKYFANPLDFVRDVREALLNPNQK